MVVILMSLLCFANLIVLILKLHQKNNSKLDEGRLFISRLKVESIPGMRNNN